MGKERKMDLIQNRRYCGWYWKQQRTFIERNVSQYGQKRVFLVLQASLEHVFYFFFFFYKFSYLLNTFTPKIQWYRCSTDRSHLFQLLFHLTWKVFHEFKELSAQRQGAVVLMVLGFSMHILTHLFIYLFCKCLLSTNHLPGTVLHSEIGWKMKE